MLGLLTSVRWASVFTVLGCGALAVVALLGGVVRGHPWAWVPTLVAGGIAVREVRVLQRQR